MQIAMDEWFNVHFARMRVLATTGSIMTKPLLIMKTGSTVESLIALGEDFEDWFIAGCASPGAEFTVTRLHLGERLPAPETVSGILITGSPANVTDLAEWNYTGANFLRVARELGVPILGVCYGHQLVAWAFGGAVDFNPSGREIGTVDISLDSAATGDPLLGDLPARFKAQTTHVQSVTRLPPGAVHLAASALDDNHAYRLDDSIWCVQFHPEFSERVMREYITQRATALGAEGRSIADLLASVEATPEAAQLLHRFAAYCQQREN
jgi:GMP synthase (glutamine-hydrolysing)